VKNLLIASIVPFDGHSRPIQSNDEATVGLIILPANAVAYLEKSGLFASHRFAANNSTRFISLCPEKL
jgi:hypothetical protein